MKYLLILLLFISCSTEKKVLNSWVNQSKHELIKSWGPPGETTSDGNNGEVLIYSKRIYVEQFGTDYNRYVMFYADQSGTIYGWRTQSSPNHPTVIRVR